VRTLAICDGANDVAMIQVAHVGVGISGQEGIQAGNSSDYAIAQFRFLELLLLVHGRWNYIRISKLVLYMFYKNITLVLAQYWYGYLSGASGSKMYWEIGVQLYNIASIVVVGVMDKDQPAPFSLEYPDLYRRGPERYFFNMYTFGRWIAAAVYESLIIFVVMSYGFNASEKSAGSESRVEFGMVAIALTVLRQPQDLDDRGPLDSPVLLALVRQHHVVVRLRGAGHRDAVLCHVQGGLRRVRRVRADRPELGLLPGADHGLLAGAGATRTPNSFVIENLC
jgi:hypothetical protein